MLSAKSSKARLWAEAKTLEREKKTKERTFVVAEGFELLGRQPCREGLLPGHPVHLHAIDGSGLEPFGGGHLAPASQHRHLRRRPPKKL